MLIVLLGATHVLADTPAPRREARERMRVEEVFALPTGEYIVILRTEAEPALFLPISVGEMEALSMRLRLDKRKPPRPLTLNLLEQVMAMGKMRVIEISIDDWRDGIFVGRIRMSVDGRVVDLDARPSDAIGLAMGKGAPIFVTRQVLDAVAIDPKRLAEPDAPEAQDFSETL